MQVAIIGLKSADIIKKAIQDSFDSVNTTKFERIDRFIEDVSIRSMFYDRLLIMQDSIMLIDERLRTQQLGQFCDFIASRFPEMRIITLSKDESCAKMLAGIFFSPIHINLNAASMKVGMIDDIITSNIDELKRKYKAVTADFGDSGGETEVIETGTSPVESYDNSLFTGGGKQPANQDTKKKKEKGGGFFGRNKKKKGTEENIPQIPTYQESKGINNSNFTSYGDEDDIPSFSDSDDDSDLFGGNSFISDELGQGFGNNNSFDEEAPPDFDDVSIDLDEAVDEGVAEGALFYNEDKDNALKDGHSFADDMYNDSQARVNEYENDDDSLFLDDDTDSLFADSDATSGYISDDDNNVPDLEDEEDSDFNIPNFGGNVTSSEDNVEEIEDDLSGFDYNSVFGNAPDDDNEDAMPVAVKRPVETKNLNVKEAVDDSGDLDILGMTRDYKKATAPKVETKIVEKEVIQVQEKIIEKKIYVNTGKGENPLRKVTSGAQQAFFIVTGDRRCGVTTTAINIATYFAKYVNTLFVDFDFERRGSLLYFGLEELMRYDDHQSNALGLIAHAKMLKEMVITTRMGFDCLVSLYGNALPIDRYQVVQDVLQTQRDYGVIIFDVPIEALSKMETTLVRSKLITCMEANITAITNTLLFLSEMKENSRFTSLVYDRSRVALTKYQNDKSYQKLLSTVEEFFSVDNDQLDWTQMQYIGGVNNTEVMLENLYRVM